MASRRNSKRLDSSRTESLTRRSFLMLGAGGLAFPGPPCAVAGPADAGPAPQTSSRHEEPLPSIPKLEDLASDRLVHDYRDYFSPRRR